MARSIKSYELVRAAIRARRQQEAILELMKAVQKLAETATAEAVKANRAASFALGGDGRIAQFVVVDGETWAVNSYGITPVRVEVL